ncbi:sensor histidine kinase [Shouchella patagoniensis]|uniref:sensor histidine kinase n=1 Tax=Shouchella patagoniensis TaxID=228576 RepID=UPI000994FEAA|nr:HAMP domain-containing sensor histidine kinase [Shouchella patagoniensis]
MKLRGQLNLLLIVTALVPFVTTSLFTYQVNQAAKGQTNAYMESLITAKSINKTINHHSMEYESSPSELVHKALQQSKMDVQLALYSKDRTLLYQSEGKGTFPRHLRPAEMLSNLYELQSQESWYVYKEPIYLNDQIIGYSELRFDQNKIEEEAAEIYTLTVLFFILISGVTLFIVHHWFNRNMIKPFGWMHKEMQEVALGKRDVKVDARRGKNEVGQLLDDFALMTSQIRETEIMRQSQEENKRKLIASISHDLKTPLTSIRAYAEGMQIHSEKRDDYAKVILSKSAYMQRLLEDLLVYSQLQATSFHLTTKRVDAEELAELLFDGYKEQWQEFNMTVSIQIDPVELNADVDRLIQVVDNLVMNAVRYSPSGGEIKLMATNRSDLIPAYVEERKKGYVYFFVIDEGKGIPSGAQNKIFESFYQVEQARSQDNGNGVGLGLAICRELILKHEGEIHVYSNPPNGSSFYFLLPSVNEALEGGEV